MALAALTVILVWLGVYPALLLKVIQTAIGSLL
jgi:NADH:ubiquinone oxidoreductase subunit 4 (subunit M)